VRHDGRVERVTGIGGVFFKAVDADALSRWYVRAPGRGRPAGLLRRPGLRQEAGSTVFAPFGSEHWESPHLGPAGWGINFRVRDLDAMVRQLRGAGVEVEVDVERYPNGRFAQLHDPEGNAVQLWEPA
jgi:catechol 2,3-dioxygenase-like lactoylglutathione lyase family enzyme